MNTSNRGERIAVYVGAPVRRALAQAGSTNKSGRINDICARYDAIITYELTVPLFTENEWCAICEANRGAEPGNDIAWRSTWANVMDTPELAGRWDVDPMTLSRRLRILSLPARVAVAEIIERFWSRPDRAAATPGEALREAGVRFAQVEEAPNVAS